VVHLIRHHATAFLTPPGSQTIENARRAWDPLMARQIAAHLTLIYPEEIPDAGDLAARAPRTSSLGEQAWAELAGTPIRTRFTITQTAITAYDGRGWPTLQVMPLTG
jgi:hypothetical protein